MGEVARAVERLTAAGYREDFRAERDGLRAVNTGRMYEPESLEIDEVLRFEGESDPDEEVVIYALNDAAQGAKGTYVVAYGTYVDPVDAEMLRRLSRNAARSRT